jgi:hypothetical protein
MINDKETGQQLLDLLDLNQEKMIRNLVELEMSYNGGDVHVAFKWVEADMYQSYMEIIESK